MKCIGLNKLKEMKFYIGGKINERFQTHHGIKQLYNFG